MQALSSNEKKNLLILAHKLHPVVRIGNKGLTEAVHIEIERALEAHELIKIKISGNDRHQRQQLFIDIAKRHHAHILHYIGFIGIFYRPQETDQ